MKNLIKLAVLAGIFSLASWVSPGVVATAQATTCPNPGGYPDCRVIAGKGCTADTPCCDSSTEGYCQCAGGIYVCME